MSLAHDIMINALMLAIPLLVNFFADGGYSALQAGNMSAIINLVIGVAAAVSSIIAFVMYRKCKKDTCDVYKDILARKDT